MSGYESFSAVYDELICDVDYKKLCKTMLSLCKKHGHNPRLVLDAACGTGNFTVELINNGLDVIGVDVSEEMLCVAKNKLPEDCVLLCQDLCELDLYGTIDTAFCTLDSLNHITDKSALETAIGRISLFLEPGGLFVFDVNTIYKHKKILADNTFAADYGNVYLVWQNTLYENSITNINLDFFIKENEKYTRFEENFDERAYSETVLEKILSKCGLEVLEKQDFFTGDKPSNTSEKIIYATRKVQKI